MYRLTNVVKDYAWGTTDAIARLLRTEPTGLPQAELWIGAHPSTPSMAATPAGERPLTEVIAADPQRALGAATAERFDGALPFLLKILSAAEPLSLQVHPSKAQAEEGYAAENAAGVPSDASNRNYKDANHKPELLYALTPFEALCGFCPLATIRSLLQAISAAGRSGGVLDDLLADLSDSDESAALRKATERLLTMDSHEAAGAVADVAARCRSIGAESARTAVELAEHYPGDIGVVFSLLLNRVSLEPGEAIFLPAGNVHAYLRGTGVEIMATSDNVLRGGLTTKHVDVEELLTSIDFFAGDPPMQDPRASREGQVAFTPPVEDFALTILEIGAEARANWDDGLPRTAIALSGVLNLKGAAGALVLEQGESVFVPASDHPVVVTGSGTLAAASPG